MPVTVKIEDQEALAMTQRMMALGMNTGPTRMALGRYGKSSTQLRFREQRGPDFKPWKPSKRVEKHGGKTLRKTGRLRNSITWALVPGGVEWGTNVVYGPAMQFGDMDTHEVAAHTRRMPRVKRGKKWVHRTTASGAAIKYRVGSFRRKANTPARAYLGVNDIDRRYLLSIARQDVVRRFGRPV